MAFKKSLVAVEATLRRPKHVDEIRKNPVVYLTVTIHDCITEHNGDATS